MLVEFIAAEVEKEKEREVGDCGGGGDDGGDDGGGDSWLFSFFHRRSSF